MAHRTWFRMNEDLAFNPVFQLLPETDQARYLKLLFYKCKFVDDKISDESIAFFLRISEEDWRATKLNLVKKNLISDDNQPVGWDNMQPKSDTSAVRMAKLRACAKSAVTRPSHDRHTPVTPQNAHISEGTPYKDIIIINNNNTRKKKDAHFDAQMDAHFEEFWKLYFNKKDVDRARKSYHKICKANPDLIQVILSGLQNQREFYLAKPVRFRPHGATWLNNGRWKDEIEADEDPIF